MAITSIKTGSSFTNLVKYNDFLGPNSAYIPSSYESIASATGTGSSATITFSSIPSTYKHLQVRGISRDVSAGTTRGRLFATFNSDTGANYATHRLTANGSSVTAIGSSPNNNMWAGFVCNGNSLANTFSTTIVDVLDYASTTKNKTLRSFNGEDFNGSGDVELTSGLWVNTAAITTVTLTSGDGNFTSTTTFALYGIKG